MRQKKSLIIEDKILEFCKIQKRKCSEISNFFNMNQNTIRAEYLYKMRKTGKLERLKGSYYKTKN